MQNRKESVEAKELKKQKTDKKEVFNNHVVRVFDDVLDDGEKILKSFKPSKLSVYISNLIKPFALYILFVLIFIFLYLFPSEELTREDSLIVLYVISGMVLLIEVIMFLITKKYLKNACYIVTNKRVIISYGFFELNFKSMKIEEIKDVQLKWSFLDKVLRKHSGQIYFYPINNKSEAVCFFLVEDPLNSYVEVENIMEKHQ